MNIIIDFNTKSYHSVFGVHISPYTLTLVTSFCDLVPLL